MAVPRNRTLDVIEGEPVRTEASMTSNTLPESRAIQRKKTQTVTVVMSKVESVPSPRPLPPRLACHHCGRRAAVTLKSVNLCGTCFRRESERRASSTKDAFDHSYAVEPGAEVRFF